MIIVLLLCANIPCLAAEKVNPDDSLTNMIDKKVDEIEAFRKNHKQNQKIFILTLVTDHDFGLVEVPDTTHADETKTSYYLLYDDQGRLLSHSEVPTSSSGDWYIERTHYFDENGKTMIFKDYSWHYNSGCTFLLNVKRRYYYDADFKIIKKSAVFTDKANRLITDPSKCEEYGTGETDADVMQPNYEKIIKRINKILIKEKKDRIDYFKYLDEKHQEERYQYALSAKLDEEYNRSLRREYIKHIIRTALYAIAALAILTAVILSIRKKISRKKETSN